MSLDKNIRENIDGKYLTIYADDFLEGIEFARQIKISQIQFVNMSNDILIDFINIEKLSDIICWHLGKYLKFKFNLFSKKYKENIYPTKTKIYNRHL